MLKVKSIKTEKHSQLQSHCYMRREDELALWEEEGGVMGGLEQQGWDVLTFGIRGRFSHHLTIHPPSLLLTGHPSVSLLPTLCL